MTRRDQLVLTAANIAARLFLYGPLIAAAAFFMPMAIPALVLSAGQPYTGQYAAKFGQWLNKTFPKEMAPINGLLDKFAGKFGGAKWWTHTGLIIGMIAAATIPVPHILTSVFGKLPGFIGSAIGGAQGIWSQILPVALLSALPLATKIATQGFDWVFRKVGLGDVLDRRDADRAARAVQQELREREASGLGDRDRDAGAAPAPSVEVAVAETPTAPAPAPRAEIRHVSALGRVMHRQRPAPEAKTPAVASSRPRGAESPGRDLG